MGTQAVVTLTDGGEVVLKAVCGYDGYNAKEYAKALLEHWPCSVHEAWALGEAHEFGGSGDRVVMTKDDVAHADDEELGPFYRETFDQPTVNPRWKCGLADHVLVFEVPA